MDPKIRTVLADLNRAFYVKFAEDFARTRRTWPLGFSRILPYFPAGANVLDLGCGNARLLSFLVEQGWRGRYTGADSSPDLLAIAEATGGRRTTNDEGRGTRDEGRLRQSERGKERESDPSAGSAGSPSARSGTPTGSGCDPATPSVGPFVNEILPAGIETRFVLADFLAPDWSSRFQCSSADVVASLAVLHHLPGHDLRAGFLSACARLLRPGGRLVLSTWQFAQVPRLRSRILPWQTIGLSDEDVEPGDYLLSWGEGAAGHRYCAAIGEDELQTLAVRAGLETEAIFFADGLEGNLNLYGVFRAAEGSS